MGDLRSLVGSEPGGLVRLQHAEVFGHVLDESGIGGELLEVAGLLSRIRSPSTMAKSIAFERSSDWAAAMEGTGTTLTESWFSEAAACNACSASGDKVPTTPTV